MQKKRLKNEKRTTFDENLYLFFWIFNFYLLHKSHFPQKSKQRTINRFQTIPTHKHIKIINTEEIDAQISEVKIKHNAIERQKIIENTQINLHKA